MAEGDACVLDSNILLRISKSDDPQHSVIVQALKALVGQGVRPCYTSQTLAEFWNASSERERLRTAQHTELLQQAEIVPQS